jgi:hypothetical protein
MRKLGFVLAIVLAGCAPLEVIPSVDAGGSDAGVDPGTDAGPRIPPGQVGGGVCDQQDDCDTCRACSMAPFEQCNRLALSCEAQPACLALADCLAPCTDDACSRACVAEHPAGRDLLVELLLCQVCDACPRDCAEHMDHCEGALPF